MIETTIKAPKPAGALAWSADNTPTYCEGVSSLYSWSSNYQDMAPFRKFLDLIGYTMEEFGACLADWANPADSLGFKAPRLHGGVHTEFL